MNFKSIRRWWKPEIGMVSEIDLDQSILDHLHRNMIWVPVVVVIASAGIVAVAAQSVPIFWPLMWFFAVVIAQLYRGNRLTILAQDRSRPSEERLSDCVRLFFLTSAAFSLATLFFPFTDIAYRSVASLIIVGLTVGGIATMQSYPPIFFSFAIPNTLGVTIGWLISTPQFMPYWLHVTMAFLVLILLLYLLQFSRENYRSFVVSQNTNAMLQRELEKAQRINDAKSKVFASASHDLRQPLQSITLLGHKLSDRSISDHERKSVAATIGVCVDLLSEELDMLLDISDLESDMSANNPELVDVCSVIESLTELYAPVAIAKDIVMNIERIQSPVVKVDRVLLTRLVRNLIDNALKYTSKGSVTITINRQDDLVLIDIEDSGQGISTQDQARIFDEFYQSGNPERDRSKGLGLGLSVVNRILPLIGGKLTVESTLNVGSRFKLQIPASDETVAKSQRLDPVISSERTMSDASAVLDGKRVLLIEDHELVQKATMALLESNGAEVLLALDWGGVLEVTDTALPDLLISDLSLPKESGLDIANRLRQRNASLPVILISGDMTSDLAVNADNAGYKVLGKPVNVPTLLGEIGLLLA